MYNENNDIVPEITLSSQQVADLVLVKYFDGSDSSMSFEEERALLLKLGWEDPGLRFEAASTYEKVPWFYGCSIFRGYQDPYGKTCKFYVVMYEMGEVREYTYSYITGKADCTAYIDPKVFGLSLVNNWKYPLNWIIAEFSLFESFGFLQSINDIRKGTPLLMASGSPALSAVDVVSNAACSLNDMLNRRLEYISNDGRVSVFELEKSWAMASGSFLVSCAVDAAGGMLFKLVGKGFKSLKEVDMFDDEINNAARYIFRAKGEIASSAVEFFAANNIAERINDEFDSQYRESLVFYLERHANDYMVARDIYLSSEDADLNSVLEYDKDNIALFIEYSSKMILQTIGIWTDTITIVAPEASPSDVTVDIGEGKIVRIYDFKTILESLIDKQRISRNVSESVFFSQRYNEFLAYRYWTAKGSTKDNLFCDQDDSSFPSTISSTEDSFDSGFYFLNFSEKLRWPEDDDIDEGGQRRMHPTGGHPMVGLGVAFQGASGGRIGIYGDPLVLDLDGDGIERIDPSQSLASFDIDGDSFREHMEWISADDGFLALDLDANGRIDGISELFGDDDLTRPDGFAKLSQYDSNADGVIDASDDIFSRLLIWRDLNGNGRTGDGDTDEGELFSLADLGVASITIPAGGVVSTYTGQDGTTRTIEDVFLLSNHLESLWQGSYGVRVDVMTGAPMMRSYGAVQNLHLQLTEDAACRTTA